MSSFSPISLPKNPSLRGLSTILFLSPHSSDHQISSHQLPTQSLSCTFEMIPSLVLIGYSHAHTPLWKIDDCSDEKPWICSLEKTESLYGLEKFLMNEHLIVSLFLGHCFGPTFLVKSDFDLYLCLVDEMLLVESLFSIYEGMKTFCVQEVCIYLLHCCFLKDEKDIFLFAGNLESWRVQVIFEKHS